MSIPAIVCGHIAFSKIEWSAAQLTGRGLAIAGLVLGYPNFLVFITVGLPFSISRLSIQSASNTCINSLCQIEAAKDQYALENGLSNGVVITFEDIGPTNTARGGYMKTWPRCQNSTFTGTPTRATAEFTFQINPIGSNAICIHYHNATPPHRLP